VDTCPAGVSFYGGDLEGKAFFTTTKFILDILKKCLYFGKNLPLINGIRTKIKAIRMENLGDTIRDERRKRKLTLERLSEKTNLSKSFLSQVERGRTQPSIRSLKKIAQEFAIDVVDLFSPEQQEKTHRDPSVAVGKNAQAYVEDVRVVRANRRKSLTLPGSKVSYDLLTPDLNRLVEVIYLRTNPAESSGDEPVIDSPGEKFGVVLNGTLEVRVKDEIYELHSGDSIYFPAHFPHSWRGMGNEPISAVWVLTPPRF